MADTTIKFIIRAENQQALAAVKETAAALQNMGATVERQSKQGTSAAGDFGKAFGSLSGIAQGVGVTFGALAIGQMIRSYADDAMKFQQEWMKVSVILRDTPIEQVNQFKQAILDMDPALGTAAQKASAFYQAISSGFTKPAEAMTLMTQSAIAASGGFTTVETALKTGAAVLNAYGLTAEHSRHVFDVMAKTVDLGVVTFEELSSSLGQIIPIAAANHVSFEELSAAIAALTLQGLPAAEAITGIRSTITSLEKPHEQAIKTAARLGIQWDATALQSMGLAGVLGQLSGRTDVTTSDIATLTGRVEGANAVMALTSKAGAAQFASSLDAIGHASDGMGASLASHEAKMQTFAGQLEALKNTFTVIAEGLGDTLVPVLKGIVADLKDMVDAVRGAKDGLGALWGEANRLAGIDLGGINFQLPGFGGATPLGSAAKLVTGTARMFGGEPTDAIDAALKGLGSANSLAAYSAAVKAATDATAAKALVDAKAAEEQRKLREEWTKATKPLDQIVAQYQQFAAVGADLNTFVKLHADEIISAAAAQQKLGIAIPPSADAMLALAVATRRANETFDDTLLKVPDAGAAIRQLGMDAIAAKKDLDTALGNLTTEKFGDEFHDPSPGVRDYLNSQVSSASEIEQTWRHTNEILNEGARTSAAEREKTWKHSLQQMSTVATDFGKDIADVMFGKGSVLDAVKAFGKSMVRILMETLFSPLNTLMKNFAGQLMGLFGGKGFSFGSIFSGLSLPGFGAKGGMAGVGSVGDFAGEAGGAGGAGISAGMGGALAAGAGLFAGWGVNKLSGGGTMGKVSGIAGGAAAGLMAGELLGIGPLAPILATLGPIGMMALAAIAAIGPLVNLFNGKNAYEAGSPEVARDFGGVQVGKKGVKDWFDKLGLSESESYPIRKDIFSSPKSITEFLFPLAQAQGKTDDFLKSLEHVATAWGTFDFRKPFEEGLKSGDFQALNAAFEKAWGPEALSHLGKFKDEWKAVSSAVDKTTDAVERNDDAVAADLTSFNGLVEQFKQTAVITPELEAMITKFGGSLRAFNDATALPGLQEMKTGFEGIRSSLETVLPNMYQEFQRTGIVTDEFAAKIRAAGGDVEAFAKFGKLKHQSDSLDKMVSDFKQSGVASPELIAILKQFAPGFNTNDRLTSKNIDALAAAAHSGIDKEMKGAAQSLKDTLDKIDETLTKSIDRLTQNLTAAIENLVAAIQGKPLPHDLSPAGRTGTGTTGTGTSTSTGTGDRGNRPPPPGRGADGQGAPGVTVVIQGDIYGFQDFEEKVGKAVRDNWRRGGLQFLGRTS